MSSLFEKSCKDQKHCNWCIHKRGLKLPTFILEVMEKFSIFLCIKMKNMAKIMKTMRTKLRFFIRKEVLKF